MMVMVIDFYSSTFQLLSLESAVGYLYCTLAKSETGLLLLFFVEISTQPVQDN